jgi:large subunit ribosomal protein L15
LAEKNKGGNISLQFLIEKGIVNKNDKVKVLGRGELKSKISVEAHKFSETAVKAIEKVGGTATTVK